MSERKVDYNEKLEGQLQRDAKSYYNEQVAKTKPKEQSTHSAEI